MVKADSPVIIDAVNLSYSYTKQLVLDSINFKINQGETIALVGANGAGKTTLLHLMFGIKFQKSGSLMVNGYSANLPQARQRMAFVPDACVFDLSQTLQEALCFYAKISGVKNPILAASKVIEEVGLIKTSGANIARQSLSTFSKGMLQRTLIAQALLIEPETLVLDEPFNGLDSEGQYWLSELLSQHREEKKTVLISTHHLLELKERVDRVFVLEQKKLRVQDE